MSKFQCNAKIVESTSSDVVISKDPSEIKNSSSEAELFGSSSLNIVDSASEAKSSTGNSFVKFSLGSNKELKTSLINKFNELNLDNVNNLYYDFFSLEEIKKNEVLNNKIYLIRNLKKDENSFTRSIIFCF